MPSPISAMPSSAGACRSSRRHAVGVVDGARPARELQQAERRGLGALDRHQPARRDGARLHSLGDGAQARSRRRQVGAPVVPKTAPSVAPADLIVPDLSMMGYDDEAAGSPHRWEDYEPGERIDHVSGITLEDSDHMFSTRLYQNTARVHFDAYAGKNTRFGRRLAYGGHVISLARALSFNGLANGFRVAAINGGSHVGPTFGGDTIYAWSEVLEKAPLPAPRRYRRAARAHHRHQGLPVRRLPGQGRRRQVPSRGRARPRLLAADAASLILEARDCRGVTKRCVQDQHGLNANERRQPAGPSAAFSPSADLPSRSSPRCCRSCIGPPASRWRSARSISRSG